MRDIFQHLRLVHAFLRVLLKALSLYQGTHFSEEYIKAYFYNEPGMVT